MNNKHKEVEKDKFAVVSVKEQQRVSSFSCQLLPSTTSQNMGNWGSTTSVIRKLHATLSFSTSSLILKIMSQQLSSIGAAVAVCMPLYS